MALLPKRPARGHKGSFGKLLVIAGSLDYAGAALLVCRAAGRSGVGLVTLAVPETLQPLFAAKVVEATTMALPEDDVEEIDPEAALARILDHESDALVVGPGLRPGLSTAELVRELIDTGGEERPPLVLDAEALRSLASMDAWWEGDRRAAVLTPHAGEFARLRVGSGVEPDADGDLSDDDAARLAATKDAAATWRQVVVLKGARTVIAAPDGEVVMAPFENPALATGGTGDVLAGAIGALLAQGLTPYAAARLGVYLHGAAGEASASASATRGCSRRTCPMGWPSRAAGSRRSPSARPAASGSGSGSASRPHRSRNRTPHPRDRRRPRPGQRGDGRRPGRRSRRVWRAPACRPCRGWPGSSSTSTRWQATSPPCARWPAALPSTRSSRPTPTATASVPIARALERGRRRRPVRGGHGRGGPAAGSRHRAPDPCPLPDPAGGRRRTRPIGGSPSPRATGRRSTSSSPRSVPRQAVASARRSRSRSRSRPGLGRGGAGPADVTAMAATIEASPGARLVGLWTHLQASHDAENTAASAGAVPRRPRPPSPRPGRPPDPPRRRERRVAHRRRGVRRRPAGAVVLRHRARRARPAGPCRAPARGGFRPVMSLHARPVRVADLPAGHGVSYGPTFTTARPSRIATLPLGYGDGYARAFSNRAEALVRGQRVPLVGNIAMDALMADVTDVAGPPVDRRRRVRPARRAGGRADHASRTWRRCAPRTRGRWSPRCPGGCPGCTMPRPERSACGRSPGGEGSLARIELWNGDICDLEVDAIVNPANVSLWMSTGVGRRDQARRWRCDRVRGRPPGAGRARRGDRDRQLARSRPRP